MLHNRDDSDREEITPKATSPDAQPVKIEVLQQEISRLKQENDDLEILLENTTEHSTRIEIELHEKNEEMKAYLQHVYCVTTAAAAVEAGTFQLGMLDAIARREDELGQLARVFQSMITQVKQREEMLKQQVAELKIEIDQARLKQQVSEITQTEYFQELKQKAKQLRDSTKS